MERADFVRGFANRLTARMREAGLGSANSKTGVRTRKLATVSGCSVQMARRYVLGQALPDVHTVYAIANWLTVSPGWLLYGETKPPPQPTNSPPPIQMDPALLEHILLRCTDLLAIIRNQAELARCMVALIQDTASIGVDPQEMLKVVDISINSIIRFHGRTHNDQFHIN